MFSPSPPVRGAIKFLEIRYILMHDENTRDLKHQYQSCMKKNNKLEKK